MGCLLGKHHGFKLLQVKLPLLIFTVQGMPTANINTV